MIETIAELLRVWAKKHREGIDNHRTNISCTYRTLINRCILKTLNYSGNYIDYSTLGHPSRPLSEPIGGRNGNREEIVI